MLKVAVCLLFCGLAVILVGTTWLIVSVIVSVLQTLDWGQVPVPGRFVIGGGVLAVLGLLALAVADIWESR